MRARSIHTLIGLALCSGALCGCTSVATEAPAPGFAGTVATSEIQPAGTDVGFALPESVSVLPEPAAFAGSTPSAAVAVAQLADAPVSAETASAAPAAAEAAASPAVTEDATKVFPAAPVLATSAPSSLPVETVAYAGPVPLYLAPARPAAAELPRTSVRGREDIERLIAKYAALYEVPVDLVRHVVNRESTFNPRAYNNGHWGLMQIKHATARGMGYDGPPSGLFDAETNLKYAVKYLRGAWLVAEGDARRADRLYQTGYYFEAKRKGMLERTGLGIDRKRRRVREQDVRLDPEGIVRPPVLEVGSAS